MTNSTMSEISIRHSRLSDLKAICAVYAHEQGYANTLQLPFPSEETWRGRLEAQEQDQNVRSLVAVIDNEVVGQLSLICSAMPRRRHVATLGMGVAHQRAGCGIGSRLLEAALDLADNWLNISRLELEVFSENAAAIALYQKYGFVREGECRGYAFRDGRYVDAVIMARFRGALATE